MTAAFGEPIAPDHDTVYRGTLLEETKTPYQAMQVWDHAHFGRVLVLDDMIQTTETDEFCYHEMLVHPALTAHPAPQRTLIIGGGDGGTLRHVLMHGGEAVMVEIDEEVTRASRQYLPSVGGDAFDNPRSEVLFEDGVAYVQSHAGEFDAIVIDSTEPIGPAVMLFSEQFYGDCKRALRGDGVVVCQAGSPMYRVEELKAAIANMRSVFANVEVYTGLVPTYPGIIWSYMVGTDASPVSSASASDLAARLSARGIAPRYYTPSLHGASFALPAFIRDVVEAS